jgi:hypothetical protein
MWWKKSKKVIKNLSATVLEETTYNEYTTNNKEMNKKKVKSDKKLITSYNEYTKH